MTAVDVKTARRITGIDPAPRKVREDQPPAVLPLWAIKMREKYESDLAVANRRITELERAITMAKQAERHTNELTIYGASRNVDDALAMIKVSPKFADLTADEHTYVARVALATGLNPEFEVHAFKNKGKLVIMPDYKALLRKANRQHLMVKDRRLTQEEMQARGIPQRDIDEGAIAYVVEGYELKKAIMCKAAGLEYEPLRGHGWWAAMKDEQRWDNNARKFVPTGKRTPNDVPNGRDGEFVAWKRATRALFSQLTDLGLNFGQVDGAQRGDDGDEYIFDAPSHEPTIEGEFTVATDEISPSLCTYPGCTEVGDVTPVGWLCATHAREAANVEAAKS
jgi:hypothetical protein